MTDGEVYMGGVAVDAEHKAKQLKVYSIRRPHHLSFHCNWTSFFTSFFGTFAPAALGPIIRESINITKPELGMAGIAAVTGTIFARIVMGTVCDVFGPRYGHAVLMLGTAPAVACMALVTDNVGFLMCRLCIGFSLATFVACQFWTSIMFTPKIVATANATAGGWGNLGGGLTQLFMPLFYEGIKNNGNEPFVAWRMAFFIPYCMHILVGLNVLALAQDLPDGNYSDLKKTGQMNKAKGHASLILAFGNYRTYCLGMIYAFCFGVELTMNNVVVAYLFDNFDLELRVAGVLGSMFGLMNLFARSLGGYGSDFASKRMGMRGRLWVLFFCMIAEGCFCFLMGWLNNSLAGTMLVMILFSTSVQAAEGATYGIVPFVSKRALGVVSGMIGAFGNAGSSITQAIFFKESPLETYEGIRYMGLMVMGVAFFCLPIWFPMWGGMFLPPREGVTEEDYYGGEYTEEEIAQGLAAASLKFAQNSRGERTGNKIMDEKMMVDQPKANESVSAMAA